MLRESDRNKKGEIGEKRKCQTYKGKAANPHYCLEACEKRGQIKGNGHTILKEFFNFNFFFNFFNLMKGALVRRYFSVNIFDIFTVL